MTLKAASLQFILCLLCFSALSQTVVESTNKNIQYEGRTYQSADHATVLSWPGSSILIKFEGTTVRATLKDDKGKNQYIVLVDGKPYTVLNPGAIQKQYTLVAGLPRKQHTVELFKKTEAVWGNTLFYGFELESNATLLAPDPKKLKLEFYGNSITCGYAVEDSTGGDSGDAKYENNYQSYASITARHFNAAEHIIAVSGIGLMVSWFPFTMTDIFDKTEPIYRNSYWNYNRYTPDIVVIDLFQNDSWIVNQPTHPEFKRIFGATSPDSRYIINYYKNFVHTLREKYPNAHIICTLGSMDITRPGSPWPGYIKQALLELNDRKTYSLFFPQCNSNGHPRVQHQQDMANQLIQFIDQHILKQR